MAWLKGSKFSKVGNAGRANSVSRLDDAADLGKATDVAADVGKAADTGVFVKPKTGIWNSAPNPNRWIKKGGKVEKLPDGSVKYTNKDGVSVVYNADGHPDFSSFATKRVEIDGLVGDTYHDFIKANAEAGLPYGGRSPPEFTWHHHQNGRTMELIPYEIHREFTHSGGASIIRNNGGGT